MAWSRPLPPAVAGVCSKDADLTPPQSRYGLHPERAADPQPWAPDVRTIGEVEHQAQERHAHGVPLVSPAEQTGMQAKVRAHPPRPMPPGLVACVEGASSRHGPQTWIAPVAVATGLVMAPSVGPTRTAEDVDGHRARTISRDPAAAGGCLVDRLNAPPAASLVRFVATQSGREEEGGGKGQAAMVASRSTRAAFFEDPTPRLRLVYTPTQTSWFHQVEIWCGILVRRRLKRASFTAVDDLRARLFAVLDEVNKTRAKPFTWTYAGRP